MMTKFKDKIANKQRIIIIGETHGFKFASIVAHVLEFHHKKFDLFLNDEPVKYSEESPLVIIVSGEKSISDGSAEFRNFNHHIGVITEIDFKEGIGYQDEDEYIRQYDLFADSTPKAGLLAYCELDEVASVLCTKERTDVTYIPYKTHIYTEQNGEKYLVNSHKDKIKISLNNPEDLKWVGGAKELLKKIGISSEQFYQAIPSYKTP